MEEDLKNRGRQPPKKMEDDLQKKMEQGLQKNGRQPKKKWKMSSKNKKMKTTSSTIKKINLNWL